MGIWIKRFTDGSVEHGDDIAIKKKQASWSRGRLLNIESVILQHDNYRIEIRGEGEYWQSDTYESIYPYPTPHIIQRRIERKILPQDKTFRIHQGKNELIVLIGHPGVPIKKTMIDQWLIAEINFRQQKTHYYISPNKI